MLQVDVRAARTGIAPALCFVLVLAVASCGSGTSGDDDGGGGAADDDCVPTSQTDSCWQAVIAAAEDEGELVLGVGDGELNLQFGAAAHEALKAHFDVRVEGMRGGDFVAKVLAEQSAGQYLWDVTAGPAVNKYTTLAPAGGLADIREVIAQLPPDNRQDSDWRPSFELYDDHETASFIQNVRIAQPIAVNRDHPDAATITEPEDLLDPRLKGQIVIYELTNNNLATQALAWLLARPEYGEDFVRQLLAQDVVFATGDQVTQWTAEGRYAVGIGTTTEDLERLAAEGIGENVELMTWGVSAGVSSTSILARPPHPNATKVFLNWFLSQEGQEAWAESGSPETNSRRKGTPVRNPDVMPDYENLEQYTPLIGIGQGEEEMATVMRLAEEIR